MSRFSAAAALRNRGPILEVLQRVLPSSGRVLEIASGSGEHVVFFARALPALTFQPSDIDAESRESVAAWIAYENLTNVLAPLALDVTRAGWWKKVGAVDAMFCANMIHISPWEACLGLLDGAGALLSAGGPLVFYGPYMRGGAHTAPSNAAFDEGLRRQDSRWGVRDLDVVAAEASSRGLVLDEVVQMPANNLSVVFRKN